MHPRGSVDGHRPSRDTPALHVGRAGRLQDDRHLPGDIGLDRSGGHLEHAAVRDDPEQPGDRDETGSFNVGTTAGCTNLAAGYVTGATVTTDLAAFVAGTATNFGWMLRDDVESSATVRTATFSAKDLGTLAQAPQLVVSYVRRSVSVARRIVQVTRRLLTLSLFGVLAVSSFIMSARRRSAAPPPTWSSAGRLDAARPQDRRPPDPASGAVVSTS